MEGSRKRIHVTRLPSVTHWSVPIASEEKVSLENPLTVCVHRSLKSKYWEWSQVTNVINLVENECGEQDRCDRTVLKLISAIGLWIWIINHTLYHSNHGSTASSLVTLSLNRIFCNFIFWESEFLKLFSPLKILKCVNFDPLIIIFF